MAREFAALSNGGKERESQQGRDGRTAGMGKRLTDSQIDRQKDRQKDRQRERNRQTNSDRERGRGRGRERE